MANSPLRIVIEKGPKRSFARAIDWPGWCRSGRTPEEAIERLLDYEARYRPITVHAGHPLPQRLPAAEVIESLKGNATTDFGAPGAIAEVDTETLTPAQATRRADLVAASWWYVDKVLKAAPAELTTGPRGGGRQPGKMAAHLDDAEVAYARKIGVKDKAIKPRRAGILAVLRLDASPELPPKPWPLRYAADRIAWHALDHAWEAEDRTPA